VVLNKTIKNITDMSEQFRYNTAIAQMMEALNKLTDLKSSMVDEDIKTLIKLLAPFAPYMAEEIWALLYPVGVSEGYTSVHVAEWPKADPQYLIEEETIIMVAVNGKTRSELKIKTDEIDNKDLILDLIKKDEKIIKWVGTNDIVKEIYIPGKMVNLVIE
jgi:leucyl-tRNA synthetase